MKENYWCDFISGVIDRLYTFAEIDDKKSLPYNEGIKFAAFKGIEAVLLERLINSLAETKKE